MKREREKERDDEDLIDYEIAKTFNR